jgi:hypothetical protein
VHPVRLTDYQVPVQAKMLENRGAENALYIAGNIAGFHLPGAP